MGKRNIFLLGYLLLSFFAKGQYSVKVELGNNEKWKSATLELISNLNDLTGANMNQIVQTVAIDSAGRFEFSGIELPEEDQLYHILLGKKTVVEGGFGISTGLNKSYELVILNNRTRVEISCPDASKSFSNCIVENSPKNAVLFYLNDEIAPSATRQLTQRKGTDSETSKQMIFSKYNSDLKTFADTCQYIIPSMVAIKMIKNLNEDFKNDPVYYEKFLKKIKPITKSSPYAIQLKTELDSLQGIYFREKTDWSKLLLPFFIGLCALLILYIIYLRKKLSSAMKTEAEPPLVSLDVLSKKEREVFDLIADGKSNKEIAQTLFIEPSTVKSHANKIFQKLNIQSRKEAIQWKNQAKS